MAVLTLLLMVQATVARADTFDFGLYWGPIPVGSAQLATTHEKDTQGDEPENHIRTVLTVRTSRFIDLFIKVRDRLEGVADADYGRSRYYAKSIHEGDVRRAFETHFDWTARRAVQVAGGVVRDKVAIPEGTLDPLSVFFGLRKLFDPSVPYQQLWATDGRRLSRVTIRRAGSERLRVPAGEWDATIVDVHMPRLDGIFRTGDDGWFRIWVSSDAQRLPLKIKAGVVVGGFHGAMSAQLEAYGFDSRAGVD